MRLSLDLQVSLTLSLLWLFAFFYLQKIRLPKPGVLLHLLRHESSLYDEQMFS